MEYLLQWQSVEFERGGRSPTEAVSLSSDREERKTCVKVFWFSLLELHWDVCVWFSESGNIYCVETPCTENQGYMTKQ